MRREETLFGWIRTSNNRQIRFLLLTTFLSILLSSLFQLFRIYRLDDDFSVIARWIIRVVGILCLIQSFRWIWACDLNGSRSCVCKQRRRFSLRETICFIVCGSISACSKVFLGRSELVAAPELSKLSVDQFLIVFLQRLKLKLGFMIEFEESSLFKLTPHEINIKGKLFNVKIHCFYCRL